MKSVRNDSGESSILLFQDQQAWAAWLDKNHRASSERVAAIRKEGVGDTIGILRGSAGCGAVLRMDRRPEKGRERECVATEIRSSRTQKHLVADQSTEGASPNQGGADEACGPGSD